MALVVNWTAANFSDYVPDVVTSLTEPLPGAPGGVLDYVTLYANVQRAIQLAKAATFSTDILAGINPAIEAINLFLKQTKTATNDLFNTGLYFLLIPPGPGGLARTKRFVKTALLNARDPRRPTFSQDAFVYLQGGLVYTLDFPSIHEAFTVTTNVLLSNIQLKRAAGAEILSALQGIAPSFYKNQLAGFAGPIEQSPWVSVRLTDLIPGLGDILIQSNSLLQGLSQSVTTNSLQSYLDFANRQFSLVNSLILKIQDALDTLGNALEDFPLLACGAPPAEGGLNALILAVEEDLFNPAVHPELEPVKDNTLTMGFIMVGGSVSLDAANTGYNALKTIF